MNYSPLLAVCEFPGALGLALGIWWPSLEIAAAIGLVIYFVRAIASHGYVGDVKGLGPAAFMLTVSATALVLRILMRKVGTVR